MKVYTYFANVPELGNAEQLQMLALWGDSWARHGWEPIILTHDHTRTFPNHSFVEARFSRMPKVNPAAYELACWMRWVAMAVSGGMMTDYDVLNFGFTPADIPVNKGRHVSIFTDNNPCPCAVHGTAEQYINAVNLFLGHEVDSQDSIGGRPHTSDQNLIQRFESLFRPHIYDVCHEYGKPKWEESKLVHFSFGATAGTDRVGKMRRAFAINA